MKLPLLISVPHAGLRIPEVVRSICVLSERDIIEDGDEGAAEVYDLAPEVLKHVRTDVARAIVDMNRAEDDRRADGVVKTHTCWKVLVYSEPLSDAAIETLLEIYYRPYHRALSDVPEGVLLGVDCHTMAAEGPPIGPDPGSKRPSICLGNREGTCPDEWLHSLADCLARASGERVSVNDPFKGGYIIRSHASELPWIQLELSREPFATNSQKRRFVLEALDEWCSQHGR